MGGGGKAHADKSGQGVGKQVFFMDEPNRLLCPRCFGKLASVFLQEICLESCSLVYVERPDDPCDCSFNNMWPVTTKPVTCRKMLSKWWEPSNRSRLILT